MPAGLGAFAGVSVGQGPGRRGTSAEPRRLRSTFLGIVTTETATVMVALTIGGIAVMFDMVRRPRRCEALFAGATWMRVINWTAAVTVAAAVGLLLGGAADVALATCIVGLVVVTAELRFLSWARPSG
jgi:hypothetical protein